MAEPVTMAMDEQARRAPSAQPARRDIVLVVDDAPETLGFLSRTLENAGMTVLVAADGEAALKVIERIVPDLILLDAVMPGMDGFDTCAALKRGVAAHVPVIFMTGLSDTGHVVRGLEAGGVDYVNKPLQLEPLLARIKVHLKNARSAQSAREALDATGRTLLALRSDGSLLWHTRDGQHLLDAVAPATRLQPLLAAWLADPAVPAPPLELDGAQGRLRLQRIGRLSGQEILVAIEPAQDAAPAAEAATDEARCARLAERFRVTPREAEVLLWIARGKSNRDVAEILSLSPRTVNKHLEHVFVKLGVESRSAAAAMAMQVLTAA
jgi:DNA-binding NarL/FixJ family response regulator